jgi:hypothetical protein
MALLDLTGLPVSILFDKSLGMMGAVIHYHDLDDSVIDLTGYGAIGEIKAECTSATNLLDLTSTGLTPNLAVVSEVVTTASPFTYSDEDGILHTIPKPPLTTATLWGVQLNIPPSFTNAITWDSAYFEIRLVAPGGTLVPFVKGYMKTSCRDC